MRRYSSLPLLLLAACAPAAAERPAVAEQARAGLAKELAGLTPGDATTCLPNFPRSDLRGYGDTLVYRVGRNLKYVSETSGGCDGVGRRDDILVTTSIQGRICTGDMARTIDRASGFTTGGCALGRFVPWSAK